MTSFLKPGDILDQISLEDVSRAVEFGCGTGKFVLALAERLPEGTVYGIDVQEKPLRILEKEAGRRSIFNLETIRGDLEREGGSTLPNESADIVFVPNVFFQVEKKGAVIREAERILKEEGRLIIIDWEKEAPFGPQKEWRISKESIKKEAKKKSFEFKKEVESGKFHFGLLFIKR